MLLSELPYLYRRLGQFEDGLQTQFSPLNMEMPREGYAVLDTNSPYAPK